MRGLVDLLEYRKATALAAWRKARGVEDLVRFQTMFNEAQETIDLIEKPQMTTLAR